MMFYEIHVCTVTSCENTGNFSKYLFIYLLQWIKDSLTICKIYLQVNLFLLSLILQPAASASPVVILLDSAIFGRKIAITSSKSSQQRFSLSNMI